MKHIFPLLLFVTCLCAGLSAQNIPSYVPTNGLLGYWPLDGNGNDQSVNQNHAVNAGAGWVADRFGAVNSAANFNGSSAYLDVATPSFSLSESGSFSYSVWIKKQTQVTSGVILMSGNSVTGNFISNVQGDNAFQYGTNMQQSAWIWITCPHTLNTWDHYVATYNNSVMKLYKNGIYQSTGNYTYSGAVTAVQPLWIGRGPQGNYYTGAIDEIGIWNRELSLQEITALHEGCSLTVTSQPANQTVNLLGVAKFVIATNSATSTFQWQTNPGSGFQNVINGGQYAGANNDTLIVSNASLLNNNQSFRCIVSAGPCKDTSNLALMTVNNSVGLAESGTGKEFFIFPNPADDRIYVRLTPETSGADYEIRDILGKTVLSGLACGEECSIDIHKLETGVYFFCIPRKLALTVKFIKN